MTKEDVVIGVGLMLVLAGSWAANQASRRQLFRILSAWVRPGMART